MRRAGLGPVLALCALLPAAVVAQGADGLSEGTVQLPFVTLDEAQLFSGTRYGQALAQELEAEQLALAAENREIEAGLARREKDLTARRPDLAPEAFRALANAFNADVESHRTAQKAKERAIYQRHDAARLRFRDVANQVLAQVMQERGALAIIAEEAIVLGFREIDITDAAITRMDALVGDGSALPRPDAGPGAQPAPGVAPATEGQPDPAPGAQPDPPASGVRPVPDPPGAPSVPAAPAAP